MEEDSDMANWFTVDLLCDGCNFEEYGRLIDRAEKDDTFDCPNCGEHQMKRAFLTAPSIMTAALPDGVRRKGFKEMAEAARLEAASFDLPPDKRGDINKAIKDLKEVKKK